MRTTSSKKSRRTDSEKIESYDILIAILVLLPLKAVLRCRCVSKRWNDIISSPHFLASYGIRTRNDQLCGVRSPLAYVQDRPFRGGPYPYQFTRILPDAQLKIKMKQLPGQSGTFVHCADGLILCHKYNFGVLNPLNSTWVKLPPVNFGTLGCAGLVSEENTEKLVPSFKVIGVLMNHVSKMPKSLCIGTYSSKTGKWQMSKLVADVELDENTIKNTFVYNGVIHWYYRHPRVGAHALLVYDSKKDENYVRMMILPLDTSYNFGITRSLHEDALWIGMSCDKLIRFWMLPKDETGGYNNSQTTISKSAWVLMQTVDNVSLSKEMMTLLESKGRKMGKVKYLELEALIPSHPLVAVLSMGHNVFLYNLATEKIELVKYRGRSLSELTISGWIPFVGSLHLSTYGRLAKAY